MTPLPVVLVGAGGRARLHSRVIAAAFGDRISIVGVVGRSDHRAREFAAHLGVPHSLTLQDAVPWGARAAVVSVTCHENHVAAGQALDLGLPLLLETPLAMTEADAAALADRIDRSGLPVEVAEQNPRFPDVRFWTRVAEEGFLGPLRLVASDGAGYRYHAAAVARALLGRPRANRASGMRVLTGTDLGRGVAREPLLAGTVLTAGGALFQLRDGEGHHLGDDAPWLGGGWRVLGDGGSIASPHHVRRWSSAGAVDVPVERVSHRIEGVEVTAALRLHGEILLEVPTVAPDAPLDDDGQAVAHCVQDWLARMDGKPSSTGWSVADALEDLRWVGAMERSALLGGAPIALGDPIGD